MRGAGAAQLGRPTQRAAHGASARRRHDSVTALLSEQSAAWRRRTGDGEERHLTSAA
jgi:hypothetical protein